MNLKGRSFHILCGEDSSRRVCLLLSAPLVDVSSLTNQKIVKRFVDDHLGRLHSQCES